MKIVVCLDDKNGMLFNKRRQSRDSRLRERLLKLAGSDALWMNEYSAGQFAEGASNIKVAEDFLALAGAGEYCFVENVDVTPYADRAESLIVYRWNRHYPSDMTFPAALFEKKWKKVSSTDFAGSSHEKLTEEIYSL